MERLTFHENVDSNFEKTITFLLCLRRSHV